jgi:hypothetical protein
LWCWVVGSSAVELDEMGKMKKLLNLVSTFSSTFEASVEVRSFFLPSFFLSFFLPSFFVSFFLPSFFLSFFLPSSLFLSFFLLRWRLLLLRL